MKTYPHISAMLFDQPWAIAPRTLENMIARVEQASVVDLEAVASKLGRPLENTGNRAETRGRTAILDIRGPIFRHANLMVELSGATSVELLARDLQTALDSSSVDNILLRIDSPGGEVGGIADFAEMIREGGKRKPIHAFIDGLGASAAYWIAAAAPQVYGSVDSFSGSIGIVATVTDRRGAQERQGIKTYQIVSSSSPRKIQDPETEEGRGAILEMVDSLGALFVERVAAYRGVSTDHVLSDFGRGFVLPAGLAHKANMIDGITSEESLIASLTKKEGTLMMMTAGPEPQTPPQPTPQPAAEPAPRPAPTIPVYAEGYIADPRVSPVTTNAAEQERARIQGILTLPEARGREALAQALAFEPSIDVASAQRILAAAALPEPATVSPLERAMSRVANPKVGPGTDDPADAAQTEVTRILSLVPAHLRAKSAS